MKYFTYQGNSGDCGFAALKMLLADSHRNREYLSLGKPVSKRRDFTVKDIIEIAGENGLTLKAYEYERKFDIVDKDSSKFLAIIRTENDANHVVMVNRFVDYRLEIYDPAKGVYNLDFEEFIKEWTGLTVEIIEVQKTKYRSPKVKKTNKLLNNYELLISVISVAVLICAVFFINDSVSFLVPLGLLTCFSVLELLGKICAVKQLEKVDRKYLKKLAAVPDGNFNDEYRKYNDFKKAHFSYRKNFLINLIVCALIMVLMIMNSPYHAIPLLFLLIVSIIDRFVLLRNNDRKRKLIDETEDRLLNGSKRQERYVILDQLMKNTYSYVFNISARKCVYSFLVICCSLVMTIIQKEMSVNVLLFEFFMLSVYSDRVDLCLGYAAEKDEYERLKAHFIDTFVY